MSATSAFLSATIFRSFSNSFLSPDAFAAPINLLDLFCSAWAVSADKMADRLSSSIFKISYEAAIIPRRPSALSKSFGLSRIERMSCMTCIPENNLIR